MIPERVTALEGADGLEAVVVSHEGRETAIEAQGIFAYLDRRPVLDFAAGLTLNSAARIVVDENLRTCVPFLFAVGDVRSNAAETVSGAPEDGRRAGLALTRLLRDAAEG